MGNQECFILMADIIQSRKSDQRELMASFKEITSSVNESHRASIRSPLTITLGDEFQGIVQDIPSALEIIFSLEEKLIHSRQSFKLRYVLVEGEIETPINEKIAHGMLGSGLTRAREALVNYKSHKSRFFFELRTKEASTALNNAFLVYKRIVDDWRVEKDYDLLSKFLVLKDYKLVSEETEKTRSQIWKREKSLKVEEYQALKEVIRYLGKVNQ